MTVCLGSVSRFPTDTLTDKEACTHYKQCTQHAHTHVRTHRLSTARNEMLRASEFDYVVENGTGMLDKCVAQMSSIIDAEKARTARRFKQPSTDLPPPESVHS